MGAFNQLNGAIFDAGAIEARLSAIDGKSIYNQRDGGILDMDSLARRLTALDGKVAVMQGGIEFDVDSFMRRLVAIEAGGFNPLSLFAGNAAGIWLDPSDFSVLFQDSTGTTPVTAATQPVGKVLDKSGRGNSPTQATTTSRPIENVSGPIFVNTFDGVDDGYGLSFAAGTLTAGMDVFIALKRTGAGQQCTASDTSGGRILAVMTNGDATLATGGCGTAWSYYVNGAIVGGVNTTTRGQLFAAMSQGAWGVIEIRDLDLSAWDGFKIGSYVSFMLNADVGGVIVCPAQSTANRNSIRTWLGAKVGLSL